MSRPAIEVYSAAFGQRMDSECMLKDLRQAYKRYLKLAGVKYSEPNGTATEQIRQMYDILLGVLRKTHEAVELNIDFNDERNLYHFTAYSEYPDDTLFNMPVRYLELLKQDGSPYLKYVVSIYRELINTGFCTTESDGILGYSLEMMDNEAQELDDDDPERAAEIYKALQHYNDIYKPWLKRIYRSQDVLNRNTRRGLAGIRNKDKQLEGWILQAVDLFRSRDRQFLGALNYENEYNQEYAAFGDRLSCDGLYIMLYSEDDSVYQLYDEIYNQQWGEYGATTPKCWLVIDDRTKTTYRFNDWFLRFRQFLMDGSKFIFPYLAKHPYQ